MNLLKKISDNIKISKCNMTVLIISITISIVFTTLIALYSPTSALSFRSMNYSQENLDILKEYALTYAKTGDKSFAKNTNIELNYYLYKNYIAITAESPENGKIKVQYPLTTEKLEDGKFLTTINLEEEKYLEVFGTYTFDFWMSILLCILLFTCSTSLLYNTINFFISIKCNKKINNKS